MINKKKRREKYNDYVEEAIARLVEEGFENIRADADEWEKPARLVNRKSEQVYLPDITAMRDGRKVYAEIAHKTENERKLVTKWRLLETLARMKNGVFKVFVPRGHLKFTRNLLSRYQMDLELVKMF